MTANSEKGWITKKAKVLNVLKVFYLIIILTTFGQVWSHMSGNSVITAFRYIRSELVFFEIVLFLANTHTKLL